MIFTPNATGALRLVGEAYPFARGSRPAMSLDNHNSVNGLREYARARGAATAYVPGERGRSADRRGTAAGVLTARGRGPGRHLSRLSRLSRRTAAWAPEPPALGGVGAGAARAAGLPGPEQLHRVQHPLEWIARAQEQGYDVLLDAAAFVPTNPLDLGRFHPDFTVVSWYKVFGHPPASAV